MNDEVRRGALGDLATLACRWEERARAAERALLRRRAALALVFAVGMAAGGVVSLLGWALGARL
ncbi:MAG: hypothetical protein HYZ29_23300 [Myxococcales bacterium]|nr:hypothetical protein [Myxococcales bacterium]